MASKIIVDQVQKSGLTALTLPTGNATANQYIKNDGAGALSWATLPDSGKVLQVLQSVKTDTHSSTATVYTNITGTDQAGAGSIWCVKITPSLSTSKILVTVDFYTGRSSGTGYIGSILLRDTTTIYIGDVASSRARNATNFNLYNTDGGMSGRQPITYLDDPSSTSELTYKVQMCNTQGTGTVYLNRTGQDTDSSGVNRTASSITVMEIGV